VKLKASFEDNDYDLTINEVDGKLCVHIEGRSYTLEVKDTGDSSYLIINSNNIHDCRVEPIFKSKDRFDVTLKNRRYAVSISDPRRLRTDENSDRHHHGPTEIRAQMPGKVVRVLVEHGTKVEKNSGVLVVEAMKMQNEMKSPRAGVVMAVNVKAGDTVNAGEVLATVGDAE